MNAVQQPDPNILLDAITMRMPFGKYEGRFLCELPVSYLEWFNRKGFPKGRLGSVLQTVYEVKLNGLEAIFSELKKHQPSGIKKATP